MTADDVRGELAAALYEHRKQGALRIPGVTCEDDVPLLLRVLRGESEAWADALLPVVDRIAGKRAAEELRAAADGAETGTWRDPITGPDVAAMLRNRAAALEAES